MKRLLLLTSLSLALVLTLGAPAEAHGWVLPAGKSSTTTATNVNTGTTISIPVVPGFPGNPFAPPPTGGGTTPGTGGGATPTPAPKGASPVSGGAGTATGTASPTTGGSTPGYSGPVGTAPVSGGSEPVAGAGEGTAPSEPVPEPPSDGPKTGGTTPGSRGGAAPNPGLRPRAGRGPVRRGKVNAFPWLDRVNVEWKAGFLPTLAEPGYQGNRTSIRQALTMDPTKGGWSRADLPSLVLTYDPSSQASQKALRSLEADRRFVSASHLFNCFRLDSRSLGKKSGKLSLAVFRRDGTVVGEIRGTNRLRGAYKLLRKAFPGEGRSLDKRLPLLQQALNALAQAEYSLERLQTTIVDPATGNVRPAIVKTIRRILKKQEGWKKALSGLRTAD